MAEFISNVAMIAALYFMVAIVLPKKIMFFFPENLQKESMQSLVCLLPSYWVLLHIAIRMKE